MPRIDPLKLLTCLKVLLASNGGIRSENEVKRLAGLMTKYSKKLVSKCIYIQILKCTNTELLGEFMGAGGWSLTHMWLSDGIHAMNWPLVQEILELLLLCPVDVQRLRSNTAPKLVKGLCQNGGNEGVRILATKLVEQWLKVVKGETTVPVQTNNQAVATSTTLSEASEQNSSNKALDNVPKSNDVTNSALVEPPQATVSEATVTDEDPLALPSIRGESSTQSPPVAQKSNNENSLVYQIVVKDGKQVLAKIENSSSGENSSSTISENNEERRQDTVEEKDASNKENEKNKNKESEAKDIKESSKDKDKSRSSRDKDRHKDNKSSSHKSSSSKSSKSSSSSSNSSSKSKSSHKSSSDSKSRDKDSEKDRDSEKEKDRHKSSGRSSSTSSKDKDRYKDKDKSSRDKDKDKQKEKEKDKEKSKADQTEKDKETLSKVTPQSIDKLGKIPKKPKEETDKSEPTSITIPSKKASMSIEIRKDNDRPKTVKTYKSQFRSHGLSEEAPPPPSRKGLKKPPSLAVPGTSIPSTLSLNLSFKRSSPPPQAIPIVSAPNTEVKESAPPVEKKLKLDLTTAPSTEKPGAIKLIAPKPKPSTLVESDLFMDALSASAYFKKDTKKRKRRSSASKDSAKEGSTTSPPESPQSTSPTSKPTPLKFYQDTLEEKDEDKMDTSEDSKKDDDDDDKKEDEDDIPLKRVKESIEEKVRQEKEEEERLRETEEAIDEEPVKKPPGPGCGPDGPPGVLMLHRRKGPKKKLTWRAQEDLEDIRYFELDETERVNVTKTFTDMKQMERFNEREAFVMARKLNCEDTMTEQTTWMPLILVDEVPPHPEGNQSKEKKIQADRESTTLKALYFNRHMIPDSPAEPDMDMEQYQKTEPAVIPLDDITGNPDAVNDFTSMPWPDSRGSPPQSVPEDFPVGQDIQIPNAPFNPFMQFGQPPWPMGGPPGPGVPPNNMMPPNIMGGPIVPFNNMNMGPPNMMMGPPNPEDIPMNNMNNMNNMNMMQPPFGPPGPNFGGPPNPPNNFPNFGPPPPMNMSPPHMNMNNNGPRNRGGNWRSGTTGPPPPPIIPNIPNIQSGGNWRPQGPGGNRPNWTHGNSTRICKQYQRGYCRNGNKCNFVHKTFI